jgi:hypothetical protein
MGGTLGTLAAKWTIYDDQQKGTQGTRNISLDLGTTYKA